MVLISSCVGELSVSTERFRMEWILHLKESDSAFGSVIYLSVLANTASQPSICLQRPNSATKQVGYGLITCKENRCAVASTHVIWKAHVGSFTRQPRTSKGQDLILITAIIAVS